MSGGSFLLATILNRKDAKTKKGKDAITAFKEYFLIKADAFFNNYFLHKHQLDDQVDNTPPLLKNSSAEDKSKYLHDLVATALRDLLPHFKNAKMSDCQLSDFPLAAGRRMEEPAPAPPQPVLVLDTPSEISSSLVEATANQLQSHADKNNLIQRHMLKSSSSVSSSRMREEFCCTLCSYKTKYEAICTSHIEHCLKQLFISEEASLPEDDPDQLSSEEQLSENITCKGGIGISDQDPHEELPKPDQYWNYKCSEFLVDSLFAISTIFEKFGDGLGMLIQSKMLLPILHGLRHTNYTSSIHRFITRALCEATPKEGLKLIHERFSNKEGTVGGNIFKDRRMEHRIGTLKRLIGNLGPNFDEEHVQLVNKTVEIKEELFYKTRKSHEVGIRSGNHVARDDTPDYKATLEFLFENEAHLNKMSGRTFGDYDLPEDLFTYFDRANFFRWIAGKNEEAAGILENRRKLN